MCLRIVQTLYSTIPIAGGAMAKHCSTASQAIANGRAPPGVRHETCCATWSHTDNLWQQSHSRQVDYRVCLPRNMDEFACATTMGGDWLAQRHASSMSQPPL